jgi:hypothetical protein
MRGMLRERTNRQQSKQLLVGDGAVAQSHLGLIRAVYQELNWLATPCLLVMLCMEASKSGYPKSE